MLRVIWFYIFLLCGSFVTTQGVGFISDWKPGDVNTYHYSLKQTSSSAGESDICTKSADLLIKVIEKTNSYLTLNVTYSNVRQAGKCNVTDDMVFNIIDGLSFNYRIYEWGSIDLNLDQLKRKLRLLKPEYAEWVLNSISDELLTKSLKGELSYIHRLTNEKIEVGATLSREYEVISMLGSPTKINQKIRLSSIRDNITYVNITGSADPNQIVKGFVDYSIIPILEKFQDLSFQKLSFEERKAFYERMKYEYNISLVQQQSYQCDLRTGWPINIVSNETYKGKVQGIDFVVNKDISIKRK